MEERLLLLNIDKNELLNFPAEAGPGGGGGGGLLYETDGDASRKFWI